MTILAAVTLASHLLFGPSPVARAFIPCPDCQSSEPPPALAELFGRFVEGVKSHGLQSDAKLECSKAPSNDNFQCGWHHGCVAAWFAGKEGRVQVGTLIGVKSGQNECLDPRLEIIERIFAEYFLACDTPSEKQEAVKKLFAHVYSAPKGYQPPEGRKFSHQQLCGTIQGSVVSEQFNTRLQEYVTLYELAP